MDRDELVAVLLRIKALAEDALQETNQQASRPKSWKRLKKSAAELPSANSLPSHILRLRNEGFFKQARTAKDVQAKLETTYPCDLNRTAVALLRLQKRKQLRRTSKLIGSEKLTAYAW